MRDVRRGRFRLGRSDIQTIFKPVVNEVVTLIMGQIAATKAPVKAVLLVGGFGQNTYLREHIRQAVAPKGIEVMQSPNGYVLYSSNRYGAVFNIAIVGQQLCAVR